MWERAVRDFITACQALRVTLHIARKDSWWDSAVLAKLAQSHEYQVSQRKPKWVEKIFGLAKTVGGAEGCGIWW